MKSSAVRCRFCGGTSRPRLKAQDLNRHLSNAWFTYFECDTCQSLQLAEPPPDLDRYYPEDYYQLPETEEKLAVVAEHERYKLDLVQQHVRSGRLLEIGPAVGGFAYLAKQAGFSVETIEMDARCCKFLREVAGVAATHSADPETVLRSLGKFQVVALWHVVEHLPNPQETLQAAAAVLSPGGLLIVATPNPESIQLAMFRSYWTHLDAPRHLQLIPARAIVESALGWSLLPVLETSTDSGGLGWNAFGWQMSMRNVASRLGLRDVPRLPARVAGRLARPLERRSLNGSTYTLGLRKQGAA